MDYKSTIEFGDAQVQQEISVIGSPSSNMFLLMMQGTEFMILKNNGRFQMHFTPNDQATYTGTREDIIHNSHLFTINIWNIGKWAIENRNDFFNGTEINFYTNKNMQDYRQKLFNSMDQFLQDHGLLNSPTYISIDESPTETTQTSKQYYIFRPANVVQAVKLSTQYEAKYLTDSYKFFKRLKMAVEWHNSRVTI